MSRVPEDLGHSRTPGDSPGRGEPQIEEVEGNWDLFTRKYGNSGQFSQEDTPPPPLRLLEGALFCSPRPLGTLVMARLFPGWRPSDIDALVGELNDRFRQMGRPGRAVKEPGGWILRLMAGALPERSAAPIAPAGEVSLAQDALDVLSLIAYRQPIPREEIDSVRGADSAGALRQLLKLGLVRMETTQAGRVYSSTPAFLEALGISTLRDLPRVEEAAG